MEKLDAYTTETLPGKLVSFVNILKKNNEGKGWVAGDSFTFADIALFQLTETLVDNVYFFFFKFIYIFLPPSSFLLFIPFLISFFPLGMDHHREPPPPRRPQRSCCQTRKNCCLPCQ